MEPLTLVDWLGFGLIVLFASMLVYKGVLNKIKKLTKDEEEKQEEKHN